MTCDPGELTGRIELRQADGRKSNVVPLLAALLRRIRDREAVARDTTDHQRRAGDLPTLLVASRAAGSQDSEKDVR